MNKFLKILGITLCIALLILSINRLTKSRYGKVENNIKLEDLTQKVVARHKIKYLKPENINIAPDKWKTSQTVCLKQESEDSNLFGLSIAINDTYLAIGDHKENKVSIYGRDVNNSWIKKREIYPPKNSVAYEVNSGFGKFITLDQNFLIVGAYTERLTSEINNLDKYQKTGVSTSISQAIYKVDLSKESSIEHINLPENYFIDFQSITADKNKVAFISSTNKNLDKGRKKINIVTLNNDKFEISNIKLPTRRKEPGFNFDMELKNNLLLLGYPSVYQGGSGLLFDINHLINKPIKLASPNAIIGQTVALSNQFAAVGARHSFNRAAVDNTSLPEAELKTLIRNIKNGSTTVIDGYGTLFLSKNILLRVLLRRDYLIAKNTHILEFYYLDDDAIPYLIEKRTTGHTLLQNGFLVTFQTIDSGKKICTEKIQ